MLWRVLIELHPLTSQRNLLLGKKLLRGWHWGQSIPSVAAKGSSAPQAAAGTGPAPYGAPDFKLNL